MVTRKTKVELEAQVDGFVENMEKAAKAVDDVADATDGMASRVEKHKQQFEQVGRAGLLIGVSAAAAVGYAVKKFADFDEAMSAVSAATHESAENMELLRDAALDAGARTVFSAEEAANAIEELAKAGVSTQNIIGGGLNGALDLAAAGGLGVADAAGIAATALTIFNLKGSDMSHVADLLAAGAGKAMGDVTDLSAALSQGGLVAAQVGLSIEETTAALSAFASQGMLGSDAGTSLKTMLLALNPASAEAAALMEKLNLSAYDQQGSFIGLAAYTGKLEDALGGMSAEQQSAALKTLFGNDAYRAAGVLLKEGESGIRDWIDAVNDQGYAADTARLRLNNLKGDLEALSGALDTALINTGEGANGPARDMVKYLTSLVDLYNDLPAPLQSAALGFGVTTAAVGLLGGTFMLAVPKAVAFRASLVGLTGTAKVAGSALVGVGRFLNGPWGLALTAAAVAVGMLVSEKARLSQVAQELSETLDSETGAVTGNTTAWAANQLEQEGILERAKRLGISAKDMTDAWLGNAGAVDRVNERMQKWVSDSEFRMKNANWKGWSDDIAFVQNTMNGSNEMLSEAKAKHDRLAEATKGSADAAKDGAGAAAGQAEALLGVGDSATNAATQVDQLADAIRGFGSEQLDAREAARNLEAAYDDLKSSVEKNGKTLSRSSEAGRENEAAIDAVARATLTSAAATLKRTGSEEKASRVIEKGRDELIKQLGQFKITGAAAERYADKLGLVPKDVITQVELKTAQAQSDLQAFLNAAPKFLTIQGQISWAKQQADPLSPENLIAPKKKSSENGNLFEAGRVMAFASGGIMPGTIPSGFYQGEVHKFAETSLPWEAYISPKPDQRERNRQIWVETGERLGMGQVLEQAVQRAVSSVVGPGSSRGGVRIDGGVHFSSGTQRDQFRELEDTLARLDRGN